VATARIPAPVSDYHCSARWELEASPEEVFALLLDAASLPRWWPSVFLDAALLDPGDERSVGRTVDVLVAAFLPLTLRFRARVTALRPPERIAIETTGDLEGLGLWAFEPGERRAIVRWSWHGRLRKPVLGLVPSFARPPFRKSHAWAMERGFTSLLLETWRRRTSDQAARDWLPRPPGPVFPHNLRKRWIARRSRREAPGDLALSPAKARSDLP